MMWKREAYQEPVEITPGVRVRAEHDGDYDPWTWNDKSDPEMEKCIRDEIGKLNAGDLVAVGIIREEKCPTCGHWEPKDSIWGAVYDYGTPVEQIAKDVGII